MQETQVQSLGQEYPVEEGMETHSSIFAWKIPWTENPGRLWPIGSQRVGHDWRDLEQQQWRSDLRILRCHICLIFIFWLCHAAYGILVPRPGIELIPPAVRAWSLTTGPPGEIPCLFKKKKKPVELKYLYHLLQLPGKKKQMPRHLSLRLGFLISLWWKTGRKSPQNPGEKPCRRAQPSSLLELWLMNWSWNLKTQEKTPSHFQHQIFSSKYLA